MLRLLRTVTATRYVTPLREGGSLPGLMEADDLGTYVVKFVGAGQGRKALIAEVVCGALARELELPTPEVVLVEVDPLLGRWSGCRQPWCCDGAVRRLGPVIG